MTISLLLVATGLVLLYFGGEWLVSGAISAARRAGLSPFIIAITVVGFGTSMPELLVSLQASLAGQPDIALGNVVGSNIANILLIAGVGALLGPFAMKPSKDLNRDAFVMLGAALLLSGVMLTGGVPRVAGLVFMALLVVYLLVVIITGRGKSDDDALDDAPLRLHWGLVIAAGFVALFAGADLLVRGAVDIARTLGVNEAVIGLTVVAVGTSLPELATTITASLRRQAHIAIGNIVGSNIFNILAIVGISASIVPLKASALIAGPSAMIMVGATALLALFLVTGWRVTRAHGAVLLAGFVGYCGWLSLVGGV
ncbi:MAG: calcium/sodium antiporter [Ahrensia sp.]